MRIGLVAMSGIRVCDADLLRLGLTLPGFVERSKAIASLPSLGLLTLGGMTPADHEVAYLEVPDLREAKGLDEHFDLVGISSYTAQIGEAYELADRLRANGVPTVMGGPHVSYLPEEAAAHCDAVVIGHGEPHWRAVLMDREAGKLKPRYGCLQEEYDLRDAPMPAFDLLDIGRYNRLTVQTSRGCPHRCEFCAGSVLFCRRYVQKPVEKVLAEIDKILTIWKHPFLELADDNSFVNRDYWLDLLPKLKERRVRWFTETDISVGQDDALLELLRASGCAEVLIGLESPVPEGLDGVEMRSNWKLRRWSHYREALTNIQAHGIRVNGCFVLGLDGQGPEIFDRVREFAWEADLYDIQITIQTPFPGTPLLRRLREAGRILRDPAWERCTLFDVNFCPRDMTVEQL
ncbi:MAG TPA: radical SAM protein, partial [Candidatus Methylomirabilis sp.]|nr:radical SAM protein [Candidatus Methylomirabilis sp.]